MSISIAEYLTSSNEDSVKLFFALSKSYTMTEFLYKYLSENKFLPVTIEETSYDIIIRIGFWEFAFRSIKSYFNKPRVTISIICQYGKTISTVGCGVILLDNYNNYKKELRASLKKGIKILKQYYA